MSKVASPQVVVLPAAVRKRLKTLARTATAPYRQVVRAKILLGAAGGMRNAAIARKVGVHVETVRRLRKRFCVEGEAAIADWPRPGRAPVYGPAARLKIVETVTGEKPEADSHWSHTLLAAHLAGQIGISAAQIGRILGDLDLKPHRIRGWLNRPKDPEFAARARAVCDLYLIPPPNAVVLSVDEKTSVQAKSRKHLTRALQPGQAERREIFFSILTRRLLRRGDFTSRDHLAQAILHFIEVYDRDAKPFRWTYDGSPLRAA